MSNCKHCGFLLSGLPAGRGDSCRISSCTHPSTPPPSGLCLSHGCPYLLEMCMGESCGRCAPHESMGWFPRSPHTATPEAYNCPSTAAQPQPFLEISRTCKIHLKHMNVYYFPQIYCTATIFLTRTILMSLNLN